MASTATWRDVVQEALATNGVEELTDRALIVLEREMQVLADDGDLRAMARASTAGNLALVAEVTRGAIDLADAPLPPQAAAFARELARRNVPMTELARTYRVVQHVIWQLG